MKKKELLANNQADTERMPVDEERFRKAAKIKKDKNFTKELQTIFSLSQFKINSIFQQK